MNEIYTVTFLEKESGKVLKRFQSRFLNKYFFEKRKRELLSKLIKDKDISPDKIAVIDGEYIQGGGQ